MLIEDFRALLSKYKLNRICSSKVTTEVAAPLKIVLTCYLPRI